MADEKKKGGMGGLLKAGLGGSVGLVAGFFGVYATSLVDKVAKPSKPVANFAVTADGLTVTCQNHASGDSGWWDFGDGTPLEQFDATEQTVKHAYAKPGNYAIKLTVRNFFAEENERTVPVDLTNPAASTPSGGLAVTNFTATPVGGVTAAPATFRVKGEVANAEKVLYDTGSDQLEVSDAPGSFDKLVVFEKPGTYPIQVIGFNGKNAVKRAATVTVSAPRSGTLSVVIRTGGTGTRVDRRTSTEMVAIPLPAKDAKALVKTLAARPGYAVVDARLGAVASTAAKNLKVALAADKKAVTLTGEWTGSGNAATKSAGGSDLMVPVILTQERSTPVTFRSETVAAHFATDAWLFGGESGTRVATLTLPQLPPGVTVVKRTLSLEVNETRADGLPVGIGSAAELKLPLAARVKTSAGEQVLEIAEQPGGQLKATLRAVQTQRAGR